MLILGGTGFIGKHLCVSLSAQRRHAVVVSRDPDLNFLEKFAPTIVGLDLPSLLNDADAHLRATDTLVYLASTSLPATYSNHPWNELTGNVQPAFEFFDRAIKVNPTLRVVYLSSGGTIYGEGHSQPIPETAPLNPISAYGYGKLATEEAIRFLGRTKGLSYSVLRVSNPVGRWQCNHKHGVVTVALRAARFGEPLHLFDRGSQIRDFLDADDLVDAIIRAADARHWASETWNIGSGIGRSITDVVDLVSEVTGCTIVRVNKAARPTDVPYAVLDCSKVARDLGWKAKINLRDTIGAIDFAWKAQEIRPND